MPCPIQSIATTVTDKFGAAGRGEREIDRLWPVQSTKEDVVEGFSIKVAEIEKEFGKFRSEDFKTTLTSIKSHRQ